MKLKKVLCIAALAAAVALTGVSAGSKAAVAQAAEETRIAGLDEVLRQMYALYLAGDCDAMYALDVDAYDYAQMVMASGADRYILDLDGNTKAMMYVTEYGGYWWYFGQMQGSLRHGQGATVYFGNGYETFTGTYSNDFPSGDGKLTGDDREYSSYEITGNFQGVNLNGVYQVKMNWLMEGQYPLASDLMIGYTGSIITSVAGWDMSIDEYEGEIDYTFTNQATGTDMYYAIEPGYALFALGLNESEVSSWAWTIGTGVSEEGLSIFEGDANALANVQTATTTTTTTADTTTTTDTATAADATATAITTVTPDTYTVVANDYLMLIAKKVYGDENRWKEIYDANKSLINDPNIIYTGQVFTMP